MKLKHLALGLLILIVSASQGLATELLVLLQTIPLPSVPTGPYCDHFAVDLKGHRLFATPQAAKSVTVVDTTTGHVIHTISGISNPHYLVYREDLDQLYVTDGGGSQLLIYSTRNYSLVASVKNLPGADGATYNPTTKHMYIANGGKDSGMGKSFITTVDTTTSKRVGNDIELDSADPEAMVVDSRGRYLYVNLSDKSALAVIDLQRQAVIATWKLTNGKRNMAAAINEEHHALLVATRDTPTSGTLAVVDIATGAEVDSLPIGGFADYIAFDPASARVYVSCGRDPVKGSIYAFRVSSDGRYRQIGKTTTDVMGKTALLVPELQRLFVAIPHLDHTQAAILVFEVTRQSN